MMSSMQYPSAGGAGNRSFLNRSSSGTVSTTEPAEATTFDPLIGRKVWTRWPEDNNFYEAVITDYNPVEVCSKHNFSLLGFYILNQLMSIPDYNEPCFHPSLDYVFMSYFL